MNQIFVSHTKKDKDAYNKLDAVFARLPISAYRAEFENIEPPAWIEIKKAMDASMAMFLLVGPELSKNQSSMESVWRYTQNWIAYEIGLASQRGIDVWCVCIGSMINFPMPYANNYFYAKDLFEKSDDFNHLREIIKSYSDGTHFSHPFKNQFGESFGLICPFENCKLQFNLHTRQCIKSHIRCPQCNHYIGFPDGFPGGVPKKLG